MRVVVALGGNALLRRGEPADGRHATPQRRDRRRSDRRPGAGPRGDRDPRQWPAVGLLALQGDADDAVAPYPLDVLGAETEGMIGYLLDQGSLTPSAAGPVATLLTQVTSTAATLPSHGRRSRSARSTTARRPSGSPSSVEAVIDKDLAAELLARGLGADALLMLTDVPDRGVAGIGALADARAILGGRCGTRVNAAERFSRRELDAMWER